MSNWVKYTHHTCSFGVISGNNIVVHEGDMFNNPTEGHCTKKRGCKS